MAKKSIFSCGLAGPTREIPSGQDGPIFPAGEANQYVRSWIQPYDKRRLIVLIDLSLRQYNQSPNQGANKKSRENLEVRKV